MQRNASALPFLLALAITRAHGEALFTDPIATNSANAPLIWLNRETTAATTQSHMGSMSIPPDP